ncbi:MAG TPA: Hpt domain-containing protein [Spirochaetota bacterium]|nr:Hpt domain-containing protein [Spirochaetota bacterium]HPI89539.1 Hpt domain-containing protein [Spirochaetota bacterium]HPR49003.1 Hpt domain-containing protein [Spirochaetota bacterium]
MNVNDVINTAELKERLDGDFELLKELITIFLADSEKLLNTIEEAINNGDSEKVGKGSHTIKGAVSNFSARNAFDAAYKLEQIGKSGDLSSAQSAFSSLKKEIRQTGEAMKELLKQGSF